MKYNKFPLIFSVILLVLMLAGCSKQQNYDKFAQCLTEKGAVMYGTSWCSHCQNQKAQFGSSFQYIEFVDCDKNEQACDEAGVTGFPTWVIDGKNYPGEQTMGELAVAARCDVEEGNI